MPDALQIATFTITFLVPSIIGASNSDFLKAVATAALATFVGLLFFEVLFGGWSAISNVGIESQLVTSASAVPTSIALGAAGFGLRRLWLYVRQSAGRRPRSLLSG